MTLWGRCLPVSGAFPVAIAGMLLAGSAGAQSSGTPELRFFYCFVAVTSTHVIYVSPTQDVGPVTERGGYGREFVAHLVARGVLPAAEATPSCVMRATEPQIAQTRTELTRHCPWEAGNAMPSCGATWVVRNVEWFRGARTGGQAAGGPGTSAPTGTNREASAGVPRVNSGTMAPSRQPGALQAPSAAREAEPAAAPEAGRASLRPERPGILPNRITPAELFAEGQREAGKGDYTEGVRLIQAAAEGGLLEAQIRMGDLNYTGSRLGVRQNYLEAIRWYTLAAQQRSAFAQLMLGRIHRDGSGVPVNREEATRWLRAAAAAGSISARHELQRLLPQPPAVPSSPPAATTPPPPVPAAKRRDCTTLSWNTDYQRPNITITNPNITVSLGPNVEKIQLRHVPSGAIRFLTDGNWNVPPGMYVLSLFGSTFPVAQISACVTYQ